MIPGGWKAGTWTRFENLSCTQSRYLCTSSFLLSRQPSHYTRFGNVAQSILCNLLKMLQGLFSVGPWHPNEFDEQVGFISRLPFRWWGIWLCWKLRFHSRHHQRSDKSSLFNLSLSPSTVADVDVFGIQESCTARGTPQLRMADWDGPKQDCFVYSRPSPPSRSNQATFSHHTFRQICIFEKLPMITIFAYLPHWTKAFTYLKSYQCSYPAGSSCRPTEKAVSGEIWNRLDVPRTMHRQSCGPPGWISFCLLSSSMIHSLFVFFDVISEESISLAHVKEIWPHLPKT